jgi:hypothetical protein
MLALGATVVVRTAREKWSWTEKFGTPRPPVPEMGGLVRRDSKWFVEPRIV